jgi:hypothetical protein
MSTDVYIDILNKNNLHEESIRIGHVATLNYSDRIDGNIALVDWLNYFALMSPGLDEICVDVIAQALYFKSLINDKLKAKYTKQWLAAMNQHAVDWEPDWDDIILSKELKSFLNKHLFKRWEIRVD